MEAVYKAKSSAMMQELKDFERTTQSLPVLFVTGTHYEVGYNIGKCFSSRIQAFCSRSPTLQQTILPFFNTAIGREIYEEYLQVTKDHFSQYLDEIRGMSDGANEPFEHLFLLNILNEMVSNERELTSEETAGCSDLLINQIGLKLVGHNEDYAPLTKDYGYIIKARIKDDSGDPDKEEQLMSFCYPGVLPGSAFSFNGAGLVITCNGLYPKAVLRRRAPRYILNRALLSVKSAEEAAKLVSNPAYGSAYGFCCNIASIHTPDTMWSMEVEPENPTPRTHIETITESTGHYYHFNMYKHLDVNELDVVASGSAGGRFRRSKDLSVPTSIQDVKDILGDTENKEYPIFRTPRPTDSAETVTTAIFDLLRKEVDIYFENTKFCDKPLFTLPLKFP